MAVLLAARSRLDEFGEQLFSCNMTSDREFRGCHLLIPRSAQPFPRSDHNALINIYSHCLIQIDIVTAMMAAAVAIV